MSTRVQSLLVHYFAINNKFPIDTRQVQKIVRAIANKAKISTTLTPHILRHIFVILTLQKNISSDALKKILSQRKILSHDRLATTEIYLNML